MTTRTLKKPISIYIHWPYCLSKCPYCDFTSTACKNYSENDLLKGYIKDIENFIIPNTYSVKTIFFGGGTPSLMKPHTTQKILEEINKRASFLSNIEITIEANPDAIDEEKMKIFKSLGINRISIGVQSLNDKDLAFLGRKHTVKTALTRINEALSIFKEVNIDLIYARPHQTLKNWEKELLKALDLGLNHYSLYQLTIEKNTVFDKKGITPIKESQAVNLYKITDTLMNNAKIPGYEISNYAKPGHECQHNLAYWRGEDYIGIGPAAHGRLGLLATQNPRNVQDWIQKGTIIEELIPDQKKIEKLLMGLRLRKEYFWLEGLDEATVQKLVRNRLLEYSPKGIRPSLSGTLVLDKVILELASHLS